MPVHTLGSHKVPCWCADLRLFYVNFSCDSATCRQSFPSTLVPLTLNVQSLCPWVTVSLKIHVLLAACHSTKPTLNTCRLRNNVGPSYIPSNGSLGVTRVRLCHEYYIFINQSSNSDLYRRRQNLYCGDLAIFNKTHCSSKSNDLAVQWP